METSRRAAVVVLMLASSGFAYAFGRQQGESEARDEWSIRLEASLPFPDAGVHADGHDASDEPADGDGREEAGRSPARVGAAGAVSSARGIPLDDGRN